MPEPKLARVLVSPEGVPLNVTVASAGARVGALALDLVIISLLMAAVTVLGLLAFWALVEGTRLDEASFASGPGQAIVVVWIIAMFLFRNGYFLYFELGPRAATWGKRAVGIRVAARDGGRLTAEAIIARNIVRDVELFLPLMFLTANEAQGGLTSFTAWAGFIWVAIFAVFPLLNRDRLRAGDLIAGTLVIRAVRTRLAERVAVDTGDAAGAPPRFAFGDDELSVYGEYELQTLEGVLRSGSEAGQRTVAQTIATKIGWTVADGDEAAFLNAYYTALRGRLESGMRFGNRRRDKHSEAVSILDR